MPKSCAPLQFQLVDQPMQRVAIDILGPLLETDHGNKYILVITSLNGKRPTPCLTWITVARIFVNEFTCQFGVPEQLHTDQGRNFESALLKEICKLLGITRTWTTPFTLSQMG